jgi:hypothetical protein
LGRTDGHGSGSEDGEQGFFHDRLLESWTGCRVDSGFPEMNSASPDLGKTYGVQIVATWPPALSGAPSKNGVLLGTPFLSGIKTAYLMRP